jgi:hypothetical protein
MAMGRVKASIQFPFINLEKSVGRAKQLYDADQRGNEMSVPTAFAVWEYSEKSSGGFQTISALKMYGLLEESGTGKIKLTKHAMDYFRDEREDHRAQRLQDFATNPPFLMELFNLWGSHVPSDTVARSYLKLDKGMNEQSSRAVLGIFKENIAFANVKGSAKIQTPDPALEKKTVHNPLIKIGDLIQWTSNGVDQLQPPGRVTWISEDGSHLRVHGSLTGIPMNAVSVVTAPTPKTNPTPAGATDVVNSNADISVLLKDGRLEIVATVDANGLQTLKEMLVRYEGILELLKPKTQCKEAAH